MIMVFCLLDIKLVSVGKLKIAGEQNGGRMVTVGLARKMTVGFVSQHFIQYHNLSLERAPIKMMRS
jgi:hypothetical protein